MGEKGVYAIYCKVNRKYYIGMTKVSFFTRWQYHIKDLLANSHSNKALQRDFNRFGIDAFSFAILEIVSDERLIEGKEKYYINLFAARKEVYNIRDNLMRKR